MPLRKHQWDIAHHIILTKKSMIWASMGAGKTLATLIAIDMLLTTDFDHTYPVLIVAPLRVAKTVWKQEAAKWETTKHLRVKVIEGTPKQRLKQMFALDAEIFVINFENLIWMCDYFQHRFPFKMVIVDESTKLKGYRTKQGSKRAQALARHAARTPRYVLLSGTPAPNGLLDLWGQSWFIDQGLRLGLSYRSYTNRWFKGKQIANHPGAIEYTPRPNARREITHLLNDVALTIDVKDYMDISEPVVNIIKVNLPAAAMKIYKGMERQMFAELESGELEVFNPAAKVNKCLQIANGAAYTHTVTSREVEVIHDAKIAALESVIEEAAGHSVLVAYHFKSDLERLKAAFPQGRELDKDPKTVELWNEGKIPVLFAHPQSAGHGLNLARGGHILAFFSVYWDLETHAQIIERIGPTRQAQLNTGKATLLYYILADKTIDEDVMERLQSKKSLQDILLDSMKRRNP
jgi:SNF2 family DNA or RNA helicase